MSKMYTPVNSRAAAAYRQVGVETRVEGADAHQLIQMLYEGLLESLNLARAAMERKDIEVKGQAIGRSVRLIEEGLRTGLNYEQGGEIARNLGDLYSFCTQQLTTANLRNDPDLVAEVIRTIEPLASAWREIRQPQANKTTGN